MCACERVCVFVRVFVTAIFPYKANLSLINFFFLESHCKKYFTSLILHCYLNFADYVAQGFKENSLVN